MYCRTCGATNDYAARFCGNCGQKQQEQQAIPDPEPEPRYTQFSPGGDPGYDTYSSQSVYPPHVPNYLVQAILVTLFCCVPFGIVSIVYAAQVNGKVALGDMEGARRTSRSAKNWAWISFGVGLAISVGWVVLVLVGFASGDGNLE